MSSVHISLLKPLNQPLLRCIGVVKKTQRDHVTGFELSEG